MNLRISATQLEQFRLFKTEEWISETDLIAGFAKTKPPTENMLIGSAFDELLNNFPLVDRNEGVCSYGGYAFDYELVQKAHRFTPEKSIRQFKIVGTYYVGNHVIDVPCVADAIYGIEAWDYKTKTTPLDDKTTDRYIQSLQWKTYADVFDLKRFTYLIVELDKGKDGIFYGKETHSIDLVPYKGIAGEINYWLTELTAYIEQRKLQHLFKVK